MSTPVLRSKNSFTIEPTKVCTQTSESASTLSHSNPSHVASLVDVEDICMNKNITIAARRGKLSCMPTDTEISHRNGPVTTFGDKPSDNQLLNVPIFEFSDEDKDLPEFELSKVKITTKIDQFDRNEKLTGLKSTYDFNSYTIDVSSKKSMLNDSEGFSSFRKQKSKTSHVSPAQTKVPTYKDGDYIPRAVREQLKSSQKQNSTVANPTEITTTSASDPLNIIDTANVDIIDCKPPNFSNADVSTGLSAQNGAQPQQPPKPQISMAFTTEQQTSSTSTLSHESSSRTISILMSSTSCLNNIWTTHQASTCPVSFSDVPIYSSNAFSARQSTQAELQPGDTGFVLSHYAAAVQSDKN